MKDKKVILITGASSGMGYESAKLLAKEGHIVYGGARSLDKMEALKEFGVAPLYLDVTNEQSCADVVKTIIEQEGKIDVLINNAGYGSFGAIEDVTLEEARRQFEVNVFGLINLTKKILPYMRENKNGRIINISSMGGKFVSYFGGWYHASKYALEALSDALRMEVSEFGIDVVLIEPGIIKTCWDSIALDNLEQCCQNGAYKNSALKVISGMKKFYNCKLASKPTLIAKIVLKAVNTQKPKARYLVGFCAKLLVFLRAVLPEKAFDFIMKHSL
ncbi:oxidoreductase [bacterium]|nr:oxidoreductase [bacterium]